MDFFDLIKKRESCRNFKTNSVEIEKLNNIIEAARLSPSACNGQPWFYYVVTNKDMLEKTRECVQEGGMNKFTSSCPAFIIIAEEKTNASAKLGGMIKNHDFPEIDIGIATAHICFAATEQGLSTCILGWFNEKKLKNYLEIKGARRIHLVIAVGYAEDNNLRVKKRKSTEDISKMI